MRLRSSAWAVPIVAAVQMDPVSTQSAISVGLMVTIIGAVTWLLLVKRRNSDGEREDEIVELSPEEIGKLGPLLVVRES